MKFLRALPAFLLAAILANAAEVSDLGDDLGYLRLHDIDAETYSVSPGPLVIDLRQATTTNGPGIDLLRALLTSPDVRFVLISGSTPAPVLQLLAQRTPTVLTLGGIGAANPDFKVTVSAEEDRAAYADFEQGASLTELANPPLAKPRRDEAAILQARRTPSRPAGGAPSAPPATSAPAPGADAEAAPAARPPRSDPVLQRAVQLHRGLRALKRI